jgi:hypothetical protein
MDEFVLVRVSVMLQLARRVVHSLDQVSDGMFAVALILAWIAFGLIMTALLDLN